MKPAYGGAPPLGASFCQQARALESDVLSESIGAHFSNPPLETVMADDTQSTKSLNNAADLAERQLERAIQVARAASFESEPAVVAAILQAIVVNHWKFMR